MVCPTCEKRKPMRCNYPVYSPVCAFHYNGECLREHNYECPALARKNLSHGEMVQLAEERKDYVKVVRCKDCKWWDKKKRVCEHPEWTDMDGWHKATDAEDYCFRAERREKYDAKIH